MKKYFLLTAIFVITEIFTFPTAVKSQDLLYFCEQYTSSGEVGVSDRFTTGDLTVMTKLKDPIYFEKITIQLDKYNCRTGKFEYFSSEEYDVDGSWTYIHFDNINFSTPGLYRVFILDPNKSTIVSGLVEIIPK